MIYTVNKIEEVPSLKFDDLIIGFFDGLHTGHQKLFNQANGKRVVLTFDFNKSNAKKLYSLQDKINIIQNNYDLIDIVILNLNKLNMTSQDFINLFLKKWNFKKIIVGEDFKFGSNQQNVELLKKYFDVEVIQRDLNNSVSTSKIKNEIVIGNIEDANKYLLQPYYYEDKVIKNTQQARLLGFPTANFLVDDSRTIPGDAIYITRTLFNQKYYPSITFIGIPKYKNANQLKHFETHLLDYDGPEFYGQNIKVEFFKKIDDVKKYNNVDDLIAGINNQIRMVREYFK